MLIKQEGKNMKKTAKLKSVTKSKYGHIVSNGVMLEAHEYDTLLHLTTFGFDIEVINPVNTPKSNNPDIEMLGTIWEIKSPETTNKKTLKKRFHKASMQASNLIFDLRRVRKEDSIVEGDVLSRFDKNANVRRMLLIEKNGEVLDIRKSK